MYCPPLSPWIPIQIDSRTRTVGIWVEGTDDGGEFDEVRDVHAGMGGRHGVDRGLDAVLPGLPHDFGRGIVYYLHGSQVGVASRCCL